MKYQLALTTGAVAALAMIAAASVGIQFPPEKAFAAAARVSFADDVLPLLKFRCATCHLPGGEGYEKSGFDLSSYQTVMKGTKYGAMIVPGDPDTSNLMLLLDWRVSAQIRMPHGKKQLSICDRDLIRTWILQGAMND